MKNQLKYLAHHNFVVLSSAPCADTAAAILSALDVYALEIYRNLFAYAPFIDPDKLRISLSVDVVIADEG